MAQEPRTSASKTSPASASTSATTAGAAAADATASVLGSASASATPTTRGMSSWTNRSALRLVVPNGFVIGSSVSGDPTALANTTYSRVLGANFSSITPEVAFKWGIIHPTPTGYAWGAADKMLAVAARNDQLVRGHTLLWDGSLPSYVRDGITTCADARSLLQTHITTVVSHYRGRIWQWDVANEVIDPYGHPRAENPFIAACGLSIVADAFRWAHAADPGAKLYLNDYNILGSDAKSDAEYSLAKSLVDQGVPIQGIGFQGHLQLGSGVPAAASQQMQRYANLGLDIMITEADVRMPILAGTTSPTGDQLIGQAKVYSDLLNVCLMQSRCVGFTVWGFTDRWSWVAGSLPGQGFACLMDDAFRSRPAWAAVQNRLARGR